MLVTFDNDDHLDSAKEFLNGEGISIQQVNTGERRA